MPNNCLLVSHAVGGAPQQGHQHERRDEASRPASEASFKLSCVTTHTQINVT